MNIIYTPIRYFWMTFHTVIPVISYMVILSILSHFDNYMLPMISESNYYPIWTTMYLVWRPIYSLSKPCKLRAEALMVSDSVFVALVIYFSFKSYYDVDMVDAQDYVDKVLDDGRTKIANIDKDINTTHIEHGVKKVIHKLKEYLKLESTL